MWQGWLPWLIVSAVVIVWTSFKVVAIDQIAVPWPGLDKAISITLYDNKPYAAVWTFQPLAHGHRHPCRGGDHRAGVRPRPRRIHRQRGAHRAADLARRRHRLLHRRPRLSDELFRPRLYARQRRRFGRGLFVMLSPFLGWVAVFLSGSDTSGNALFGNLQVVAAKQLGLNPILFAAANSSGGVMGKMISPQNIATGVSVTELKGREGEVVARTFPHSVILTLIFGLLVALQQYVIPWIIPAFPDHDGNGRAPAALRAPPSCEAQAMSQIAFPPPDPTILARRDEIVAGLAAILPRRRPDRRRRRAARLRDRRVDRLSPPAARRRAAALGRRGRAGDEVLPRRGRQRRAARRRHVAVRRRNPAGGRDRRRPVQDEPHPRDQSRRPLCAGRGRRHQPRHFGGGRGRTAFSTRPTRPRSSPAPSAAMSR